MKSSLHPKISAVPRIFWESLQISNKITMAKKPLDILKYQTLRNLPSNKLPSSARWILDDLMFLSRKDLFSSTTIFILSKTSLRRKNPIDFCCSISSFNIFYWLILASKVMLLLRPPHYQARALDLLWDQREESIGWSCLKMHFFLPRTFILSILIFPLPIILSPRDALN